MYLSRYFRRLSGKFSGSVWARILLSDFQHANTSSNWSGAILTYAGTQTKPLFPRDSEEPHIVGLIAEESHGSFGVPRSSSSMLASMRRQELAARMKKLLRECQCYWAWKIRLKSHAKHALRRQMARSPLQHTWLP